MNSSGASQDSVVDNNITSHKASMHNLLPASTPVIIASLRISIDNLVSVLDNSESIYTTSTQLIDSMSIDEVSLQSQNIQNNIPVQPNICPDEFSLTTAAYHNTIHLGTLPYFFHRVGNPMIQQSVQPFQP
jgi:hypothetical protein